MNKLPTNRDIINFHTSEFIQLDAQSHQALKSAGFELIFLRSNELGNVFVLGPRAICTNNTSVTVKPPDRASGDVRAAAAVPRAHVPENPVRLNELLTRKPTP